MTGTTVSIIHSGLLPLSRNASTTFSRLAIFLRLASELTSRISWRRVSASWMMSSWRSRPRIASAPMPASNASPPSSSSRLPYCSSVRSSQRSRPESFGSMTM
jgi:hypothetical protein